MPEPVSATIGICLAGYTFLSSYAHGDNAISPEARAVQEVVTAARESVELSQALFGAKAAALSELTALANECAVHGWDGEEASAIDPLAIHMAEQFVRALPDTLPLPEFAAEPDGSVSLDWIESRSRLFSLSVGASHRLAYAWLDGTDRGHGVVGFDGQRIPRKVIEGICDLTTHGDINLRTA